ncbi:DUF6940 family protein [Tautonia plasticadhaerens]|uniref:Uncharacterized protein n=1 Tax=Tautonia plasticadhaerens TaxID=2527974 RepID=A0A518H073_9BACT|nr:hypothetical protein [Tautonia plasticadhaerens]QDV34240.1 hypothetical protein ElP_21250 [Tautonia plasticadhaerens]
MWRFRIEELDPGAGRGQRFALERGGRAAPVMEAVLGWKEDPTFRSWFNETLAESPFLAFRWETPAVTAETADLPFEFVLLDSPGLARDADPAAFADHFECAEGREVLVFPNLGGDALLIVPCPMVEPTAYGHLASFVSGAPEGQRQALWQAVGEAMARRLDDRPVWLNTAGCGVPWLHVRLDDRPKYYGFGPYRATDRQVLPPEATPGRPAPGR